MSTAELEEQTRLTNCQERIGDNLRDIGARLAAYAKDIQANKDHMW